MIDCWLIWPFPQENNKSVGSGLANHSTFQNFQSTLNKNLWRLFKALNQCNHCVIASNMADTSVARLTVQFLWFITFWESWYFSVQILMGVIKPGSKVMSALYNHSWWYSQEACFDVVQPFGVSLWDPRCDWQGR